MTQPLLQVDSVSKTFFQPEGSVQAVRGVSLEIKAGETLGLVGESGSGKTTLLQMILRLRTPTSGRIFFQGEDIAQLSSVKDLRRLRKQMQVVFQDPYSSLNPRMTLQQIIREPLDIHKQGSIQERKERVDELLSLVGLPSDFHNRYPGECSGGQRQRVGIARALALQPALLVCDEPISSLDLPMQAQILSLLGDLQQKFGLAYLFIAHDLKVVRNISDRVAIMYQGEIVEQGYTESIYGNPTHEYTKTLLSAFLD